MNDKLKYLIQQSISISTFTPSINFVLHHFSSTFIMQLLNTNLGRLRVIGFAEAISWILLLCIAMPLKYIWHQPLLVKYVGWVHGILFMAYVIFAYIVKEERNWTFKKLALAIFAAFLPFGTLYFDSQLKKEQITDK